MRGITTLILRPGATTLSFEFHANRRLLAVGSFERIGSASAYFSVSADDEYSESVPVKDHRQALRMLIDYLHRNSHIAALLDIHAVIYRIPHGGDLFDRSVLLARTDVQRLERISHLTPEGRSVPLLAAAGLSQLPSAQHVGVFDTAGPLPPDAALYALDRKVAQHFQLRRHCFQAIMHRGAYGIVRKRRRVISIVIDENVSVAAFLDGAVVDTTTGFTQAEGLPGLRRSGSIDPRIPLYLATHLRVSPAQIDTLLSSKSGIAAMSGKASYAQVIAGAKRRDVACINALMLLSSRVGYAAAGMTASLGGVDTIVFSGSGASWEVIEEVCRRLGHLGVRLGKRKAAGTISSSGSRVVVLKAQGDETSFLMAEAKAVIASESSRMFKNRR